VPGNNPPPADIPCDYPLEKIPEGNPPVCRLESGPRLVGRIGSGVPVSASFQVFALRTLLHSTGVASGGCSQGVNLMG